MEPKESSGESGLAAVVPPLRQTTRPRRRRAAWIAAIGVALGFVGVLLAAIEKVRSGSGGELYRTAWGYRISYVEVVIFPIVAFGAMLVGSAIGWWQRRNERDFERKYPELRS